MELLSLLWAFFKIGVVSFGGGWSIVGLIKAEVVPRWLDETGFRSLIAIAQSTPGPVALNTATLVGWQEFGVLGALLSTLSVIAFPVLAIAAAGFLGSRARLDRRALQDSLKTGTISMMAMTFWFLIPRDGMDPLILVLALSSFGLSVFTKLSPLWVIFGAGFVSAILKTVLELDLAQGLSILGATAAP